MASTTIDSDMRVLRGDTATVTMTLVKPDANGKPQPFPIAPTTHEVWFTVKDDTNDADGGAWIRKKMSSGEIATRLAPNDHVIDLTISAGETGTMPPGTYFYDAQVKVLASGEVRTMAIGRFIVLPDVTRAT